MDPHSKAYSPTTSDAEVASEKMAIQQPDETSRNNNEAILEAIKHKKHVKDWDGSGVDFSQVDEKKTLRKMDIRLIPVLAVLYLLSFLDRG